jgi:hypothetical protein
VHGSSSCDGAIAWVASVVDFSWQVLEIGHSWIHRAGLVPTHEPTVSAGASHPPPRLSSSVVTMTTNRTLIAPCSSMHVLMPTLDSRS